MISNTYFKRARKRERERKEIGKNEELALQEEPSGETGEPLLAALLFIAFSFSSLFIKLIKLFAPS